MLVCFTRLQNSIKRGPKQPSIFRTSSSSFLLTSSYRATRLTSTVNMQLTRVYTFFLFLVSFGLFAHAKPVGNGLTVRDDFGKALEARNYPSSPCNCGHDLVDVLVDLKVKIDASVLLLDGVHNPTNPCNDIIAAIKVAIDLVAKIDLKVAFVNVDISLCVSILVQIILAILAGCSKYGLLVILSLTAKIDVVLGALLTACIKLCPTILVQIVLNVDLLVKLPVLILYGFVNVVAVLGL